MKTDSEIRAEGMAALVAALGADEAERFVHRFPRSGLMEIKGGSVDFLCAAYVCKTAHAAPARRIKLGCRTPSFGVCPCGVAGGTLNHSSL